MRRAEMKNLPTTTKALRGLRVKLDGFASNENGAVAIEYALIASLISALVITQFEPVRVAVSNIFTTIANAV